jgi:hypothetical protein
VQFKNRKEYEPTHIKTLVEMLDGDKEKAASLMGCHYATVVTAIREDVATRRQEISAHKAIIRLETEESIRRRQEAEAAQAKLNELLLPPLPQPPVLPLLEPQQSGHYDRNPPLRRPIFMRPVEEAQVVEDVPELGPSLPPDHMVQVLVSIPANKLQSFHRVTALMGAEVAEL